MGYKRTEAKKFIDLICTERQHLQLCVTENTKFRNNVENVRVTRN